MNSSARPSCIILGRKGLIIIKSLLKLGLLVLLSTCFYEETISYRVDSGSTGAGGVTTGVYSQSLKSITAGGAHTCAILTDGSAKCWGRNNYGQIGDGTTTNRTTPVTVQF